MFSFLSANQILQNEPLSKHTTIGVGGTCSYFLQISSQQITNCIRECQQHNLPYFFIGLGSNLLVADSGYNGVVIKVLDNSLSIFTPPYDSSFYLPNTNYKQTNPTTQISNHTTCKTTQNIDPSSSSCNTQKADNNAISPNQPTAIIRASAFCKLANIVTFALQNSLSGLEWAIGLPSSLGGAIYGNAGANGSEIANILQNCTVLDNGLLKTFSHQDCHFSYRDSIFKTPISPNACSHSINAISPNFSNPIILSADLLLHKHPQSTIQAKMQTYRQSRIAHQPKGKSMGCVFKNGRDKNNNPYSAGKLIDLVGLKGFHIGKVHISPIHANFIINNGDNAQDIYDVIQHIKQTVSNQLNIHLQEEIRYIGQFVQ